MTADDGIVLVAEDDEAFAETVRIWLEPAWTVRLAHDGEAAVDAYASDVDVMLVDRGMPMLSGSEVIQRVHEQGGDPGIAVMTAVSPDERILGLDFDLYLQKPVTHEELVEAVASLSERTRYPDPVRQLYSLRSKLRAFRETHSPNQLESNDHYQQLEAEFDDLTERVRREFPDFADEEIPIDDDH